MSDTVVVTDTRLDSEKFMLDGIDVSAEPTFKVSDVAKVFFGRSSHWVRWLEGKSALILDGDPEHEHVFAEGEQVCSCGAIVVGARRTAKGARVYTLADVEMMTHALAQQGKINGAQAANALHVVQTIARIWQYIP